MYLWRFLFLPCICFLAVMHWALIGSGIPLHGWPVTRSCMILFERIATVLSLERCSLMIRIGSRSTNLL